MYPLGFYPQLLPLIGAPDELELVAFSEGEIAQAEFVLKHGTQKRYEELIDGLSKQIDALRDKDSLYSKLGLYGSNSIRDELDAAVVELDASSPDAAPHAAIYGRRFPKDNRDRPIVGKLLATVAVGPDIVKVTDSTGVFGDSYWATTATPEGRLNGRNLTMTSGARKGQSYVITTHVYEGIPYVRIEDVPTATIVIGPGSTQAGDRFKIDGDGLPQDDLDKWDRGNDWMIVTAIRGTLTGAAGAILTCGAVFDASSYWIEDAATIPGNLAGREIIIEGVGTRSIVSHNPAAGQITVDDGTGIVGNERFRIQARSPAETGKQSKGTLAAGDVLEPGCKARVTPSSVASLGAARAELVRDGMSMVKRYQKLRWHRFRGTVIQLRYLSRNAVQAVEQYEDEKQVGDDILNVAFALGIQLNDPEPLDPPAAEE